MVRPLTYAVMLCTLRKRAAGFVCLQCSEVLAVAAEGSEEHREAQRLAARALFIAGDMNTAIARLEELLAASPAVWRARAELMDCYRRAGRLDDGAAHIAAAASGAGATGSAAPGFHYCRYASSSIAPALSACLPSPLADCNRHDEDIRTVVVYYHEQREAFRLHGAMVR